MRLLPLSLTLLLFAAGVPKLMPDANPRRVVNAGFLLLFAGLVLLVSLLDIGGGGRPAGGKRWSKGCALAGDG